MHEREGALASLASRCKQLAPSSCKGGGTHGGKASRPPARPISRGTLQNWGYASMPSEPASSCSSSASLALCGGAVGGPGCKDLSVWWRWRRGGGGSGGGGK